MDDYNVSMLSEAKNEYSIRLINILTPLIIEGLRSIFKEAWDLCAQNDEIDKYLMTFQNFLTRVPKWNQDIIDGETKRIIERSRCNYLEDLLTCVHITQLKILTSVRVSAQQKKVEIVVPKLADFVHKAYIKCARKLYTNVYLFEEGIAALAKQKNARECEMICKECTLEVIRDSMPVEQLLRAYIDETTEEEVVEEQVIEPAKEEKKEETDKPPATEKKEDGPTTEPKTIVSKEGASTEEKKETDEEEGKVPSDGEPVADKPPENVSVKDDGDSTDKTIESVLPEEVAPSDKQPLVLPEPAKVEPVMKVETETSESLASAIGSPRSLSFNDRDRIIDYASKEKVTSLVGDKERTVSAPKTIDRLEEISELRSEQRKAEDEEDGDAGDKIQIMDSDENLPLDALDIQVLGAEFDKMAISQ